MSTENQIQANRRNALRSTGPKTPEGKAAVRLNALRHGLRARGVLIPGENPDEYRRICADLESDWRPRNRTEQLLVEQMAVAQWKLARVEIGERSIFAQDLPAERQLALLDRFSAYRGRLERSFSRALREIERLRKTKAIPEEHPAAAGDGTRPDAALAEGPPRFAYVMADPVASAVPLVISPAQPDSR